MTAHPPGSTPSWPAASGLLRASDRDRDQVAEFLHDAYARGRISAEEHSERLEATNRAKTYADLTVLTADLVPPSPAAGRASGSRELAPGQPDRMTAVLSEVKREGPWVLRARSYASTFLGSITLDLTSATYEASTAEINVSQLMGSLHLRVPAGTTVRDETSRILGEVSVKALGPPEVGGLTLVLRGTNVLSEIKVRGPRRPPPWRRALT